MLRNSLLILLILGLAAIMYNLYAEFTPKEKLGFVAEHYANNGKDEVGAANLVTAVVVTYRGLDTLGEVSILFLTAAIIGFFLKTKSSNNHALPKVKRYSEILGTGAKILVPIIVLLGTYVFINGHLTPGGGFQGGAIIASAFVLMLIALPRPAINHRVLSIIESLSGVSFVIIGLLGIVLAGGFLDNQIIGLGTFGTILSAGTVPIIYILVGLKVGTELTGIIRNLKEIQNEE
ncbi:MAG: MnhB domain-containing protein [Bacteroidales bacterium]|nr:MnhB domain-containing protein [Bacteroidales bacterium]MDY0142498.1 MnhB domain-containing protein [Bacteroidales bacterium]